MPPNVSELYADLSAADKAGDMQLAQHIAGIIRSQNTDVSGQALDTVTNVGKGAVASLVDIGRTVTKPLQWMFPAAKRHMDEAGVASRQLRQEAGAPGMLGSTAVDIAGTGGAAGPIAAGLKGIAGLASALPRAAAAASGPAAQAATFGGASGAYLSPDDPVHGAKVGAAPGCRFTLR